MEMEDIRKVIGRLLKETGIEKENELNFIHDNWSKIAGEMLGKVTEPVKFDGKKLIVHADNSVVMAEAGYMKKEILRKINDLFMEKDVKEIVFRIKK
jgi:predicted nucleic acid-binding Zn ribbon protein